MEQAALQEELMRDGERFCEPWSWDWYLCEAKLSSFIGKFQDEHKK